MKYGAGSVLAGFLCSAVAVSSALAQGGSQSVNPGQASAVQPGNAGQGSATKAKPAGQPTHYLPNRFAGRAGMYYKSVWGIDSLSVKWAESGELVRFTWRVVDPDKARVLSNSKAEPSMVDPQAGVSLVVPTMEKVGQLRQTATPEAGRSYWMAFSNAGQRVKRGDRVTVIIGPFRAENLMVD